MIAKVLSSAVLGIDAYIVEVEADISSSRALISITYPSNFMLVAAMNPCPFSSSPQTTETLKLTFRISRYPAKTLGQWIRRLRLEKGLFQRELARLIGVDETTILSWVRDRTRPGQKHVSKLADLFMVKKELLLELSKCML